MTDKIERIFEIEHLDELQIYLSGIKNQSELREQLFSIFLSHVEYRTVEEWNKCVRLCETLAIIGWGQHEALEATRGKFVNGYPDTGFINAEGKPRFRHGVWTPRTIGLQLDKDLTGFYSSPEDPLNRSDSRGNITPGNPSYLKLEKQRNWIPKNPVYIRSLILNCYPNSKAVIESAEKDLMHMLNKDMRPAEYGPGLNEIVIFCSFSFFDNEHCMTNYIIADETMKLTKKDFDSVLYSMLSKKEIDAYRYRLRNRYDIGNFVKSTGRITLSIYFEKEFSQLPHHEQKQLMSQYFNEALQRVATRLRKKIDYNFDAMLADFDSIVRRWLSRPV